MSEPEIILNLWYVMDDQGIVYSLRARSYVHNGTDEEKLALLRRFAETDYLIAQSFPIPERLHITIVEGDEQRKMAVASVPALEATVGVGALFEEVFQEMENQLPAQTKLCIGQDPFVCITPLIADERGNMRPLTSSGAPLREPNGACENPTRSDQCPTGAMECDFLTVIISRQQIEAGDISEPLRVLRPLLDPASAIKFCEHVDIGVAGYDHDPRELYEIPEVRDFVHELDAEFPYWLYFLTKRGTGLGFILSCFCSPFLTPEEEGPVRSQEVGEYLLKRGFPGLNHICEDAGCSEEEIRRLTDRATEYVLNGPDTSDV